MIFEQPYDDQLGWPGNPFKAVAHAATSVAKGVAHGTVAVSKGVAHGTVAASKGVAHGTVYVAKKGVTVAKTGAMLAFLPVVELNKLVVLPAVKFALRPVKSKIDTLKDRRAKKIAWDKRKSKTPTPAERAEASAWTKSKLRGEKPPFGLLMSTLAGAQPAPQFGDYEPAVSVLGEPATATIIASIPVMLAILNALLNRASGSGEAPAQIGPDGQPIGPGAPGGPGMMPPMGPDGQYAQPEGSYGPGGQGVPGGVPGIPGAPGMTADLGPTQDAAAQAQADAAEASGGGGGMPAGINKSHLMIGGAVVVGLVVLSMVLRKKD